MTHNHANYQDRLAFIQRLLVDQLGLSGKDLEQAEVTPIQYDPECPFKYNNFVCRLKLPVPVTSDTDGGKGRQLKQPGCVPIPSGTKEFILRLNNPDAKGLQLFSRSEPERPRPGVRSASFSRTLGSSVTRATSGSPKRNTCSR
ncbi:hypothetical protein F4821DRAFT_55182 [Hypoxylon rubiginosum]|uniref:Uncharacterized protein n=1 Tax=Hypoxylon rubiginosum TaxID=110542 RepID=A0ACC0CJC3_9PEZI|nr:hypothetical protein F4821DRAFT_55182 [Hypoxylon rubiginosum]